MSIIVNKTLSYNLAVCLLLRKSHNSLDNEESSISSIILNNRNRKIQLELTFHGGVNVYIIIMLKFDLPLAR